jgi:hypothetical protein
LYFQRRENEGRLRDVKGQVWVFAAANNGVGETKRRYKTNWEEEQLEVSGRN